MHKKFEINRTKIKGSCQSGRKVVTHDSKSDLTLITILHFLFQNAVLMFMLVLMYLVEVAQVEVVLTLTKL